MKRKPIIQFTSLDRYSHLITAYCSANNDMVVGQAALLYTDAAGRDELWFSSLYIKPEYRRQGIGGRIIDMAKAFADGQDRLLLVDPLRSSPIVIKLYKDRGFVEAESGYLYYGRQRGFHVHAEGSTSD